MKLPVMFYSFYFEVKILDIYFLKKISMGKVFSVIVSLKLYPHPGHFRKVIHADIAKHLRQTFLNFRLF